MKLFRLAAAVLAAASLCAPAIAQQYDSTRDPFASNMDVASNACSHWVTITPSDTTDLTSYPRAVFVGSAGNVAMIGIKAPNGATGLAWKNVAAGSLLPARPRRILATGTTATDILGCY